uniref:Uncharacterized protein n=1 Tax=Ditylenchus dipsaci TaxID=166011 RepID=A0A915DMU7_9BILA
MGGNHSNSKEAGTSVQSLLQPSSAKPKEPLRSSNASQVKCQAKESNQLSSQEKKPASLSKEWAVQNPIASPHLCCMCESPCGSRVNKMLRHLVEEINEGYYSDSSESEQEEIVDQEAIVPAVRRRPQPQSFQPSVAVLSPQSCPSLRRCVKVTEEECKARVHTDNLTGQVVDAKGEHTHGRSAIAVPVRNVKNEIKRRAVVTMEKPSQIFNTILRGVLRRCKQLWTKAQLGRWYKRNVAV